MIGRALRRLPPLVLAHVVLVGCAVGPVTAASSDRAVLTVMAAASLTEVFGVLAQRFEAAHPDTTVTLVFGSSASLAAQIRAGAPADVFAAASESTMRTVTDAGAAQLPQIFAANSMEIAVPLGNPAKVSGVSDFARQRLRLAVCAEQVPCGVAARQVFAAGGVDAQPDTLEADVKAVLQKVASGEVDAGMVYRTDVRAARDRVQGIAIPDAVQAVTRYPIAALTASGHPDLAQEFVQEVLSPASATVLAEAGFARP